MSGVILAAAGDPSTARGTGRQEAASVVAVDRAPAGLDVDTVMIDGRSGSPAGDPSPGKSWDFTGSPASPARRTSRAQPVAERGLVRRRRSARRQHRPAHLRHTDYRVGVAERAMRELLGPARPARRRLRRQQPDRRWARLQVLLENGLAPPDFGLAVFGELPFELPPSDRASSRCSRPAGTSERRRPGCSSIASVETSSLPGRSCCGPPSPAPVIETVAAPSGAPLDH